jgi:ATP/maltotriose-dependent transcriptional regulator MalT
MKPAPYCGGMMPEMSGLREGDRDPKAGWAPSLDPVEAGLGRLQQQLAQLDRELRQTRADYRRFVELSEGQVRNRLPELNAFGRLTQQERRVATLAACGHSNLEVAAQLHVTVHTVKSQMGSVLRKLDLRSRWELDHLLRSEDGRAGRPAQTR